ncbi:hypothetical protein ACR6C2_29900 [Streptomyces sp. INA 01156]
MVHAVGLGEDRHTQLPGLVGEQVLHGVGAGAQGPDRAAEEPLRVGDHVAHLDVEFVAEAAQFGQDPGGGDRPIEVGATNPATRTLSMATAG